MTDWKHEYDMLARAYKRLYLINYRSKYNLNCRTTTQIAQMLDDAVVLAIMAEESITQQTHNEVERYELDKKINKKEA